VAPAVALEKREPARALHRPACRAFSLIEILVTMGLLTLIVLGLLAMFNQTQRAFTSSMTTTDVLAAGRATMDLFNRELREMTPSEFPDVVLNGGLIYHATNFFVEPCPGFDLRNPFAQQLTGNSIDRTNFVQRFFFLTKLNQDWIGIGYAVIPDDTNSCVGTLYRFSSTNAFRYGPYLTASGDFLQASQDALLNSAAQLPITNVFLNNFGVPRFCLVSRIADGIVHFRVRAYAANGSLIVTNPVAVLANAGFGTNNLYSILPRPLTNSYGVIRGVLAESGPLDWDQSACYFWGPAVPAYVEIELGILEPNVLKQYQSIPIGAVQRQFLATHAAQVHLFRQRIPVANIDFTAYP
jgi:type II secretory pathway pseudopilin PulG